MRLFVKRMQFKLHDTEKEYFGSLKCLHREVLTPSIRLGLVGCFVVPRFVDAERQDERIYLNEEEDAESTVVMDLVVTCHVPAGMSSVLLRKAGLMFATADGKYPEDWAEKAKALGDYTHNNDGYKQRCTPAVQPTTMEDWQELVASYPLPIIFLFDGVDDEKTQCLYNHMDDRDNMPPVMRLLFDFICTHECKITDELVETYF